MTPRSVGKPEETPCLNLPCFANGAFLARAIAAWLSGVGRDEPRRRAGDQELAPADAAGLDLTRLLVLLHASLSSSNPLMTSATY